MSTIARMDVRLAMDAAEFERGVQQAQATADSFAKKLGGLGQTMSLAVTAPLVGIAGMAVKSAADFESSMNVMGQVTGATGDQMAQLQAQALELGAVTSFSAGEAAEAMLELGKAGLAPAEIMGAIGGTMDLAAAGGLDLAQAATIAANAMNAFQLPASEVTNVANMLAAAANASSVDVTDLAQGMQMAGAVFASNGQSVEDLTTALAILGNNAITGSDAGTSLKTMLMRLTAPTDEAAAAINALGLEVFNSDGSMRGFADIVGQLETATAGLTDQERSMALSTIFGADAIRAATILAREGADGFTDMSKAVNKGGAAAATANARMKGFGGAVEYLKGSIDSFLINAALPFLDSLSGMVRYVADLISLVGNLPAPVRNTAIAIGAVLAATGPLLLIVSKLIPVFGMLGTVLGAIASPIGLVVVAVGALVAAFATDFMGVRTAVMGMVDSLLEMAGVDLGGVIDGVQSLGKYLAAAATDGDALNDWLTHLPEPIQPAVMALGQLVAAFGGLVQTGDLGAFIADIQAIDWGGALGAVGDALTKLKDGIAEKLKAIDWGGALATAAGWLDGLKQGIINRITTINWGGLLVGAGDILKNLWSNIAGALGRIPWQSMFASAAGWLDGLKQGIVNRITTINWGALLQQAGDFLAGLWRNIVAALGRIPWGTALSTATKWLDNLKERVIAAIQGIKWADALTAAGDVFAGLGTALGGALGGLNLGETTPALDSASAAFTGIASAMDTARGAFNSLLVAVAPVAAALAAFLAPALARLQESVLTLPDKFATLIPKLQELGGAIGELTQALAPFVMLIGAGLAIAVDFGINTLTATFETLPAILGVIIDQVTAIIKLISSTLNGTVAIIKGILEGNWKGAWDGAQQVAQGFIDYFRGNFSRLGTFVEAVARRLVDPIKNTLRDLVGDVVPIFNNIRKTFEDWWNKVVDTFKPVTDAITAVRDAMQNLIDWISKLKITWPWEGINPPSWWTGGGDGGTPPSAGGQTSSPTTTPTTGAPLPPNNQIFDPYTDMDGSSMFGSAFGMAGAGAPLVGPVYVTNEVDLNALAWQVLQLLNRRR